MIKTYTIKSGQKLSDEERKEIDEARKAPIFLDEDCEELSDAMIKAMKSAIVQRNRKRKA